MVGLFIKKALLFALTLEMKMVTKTANLFFGNTIDLTLFFVVGPIQIIPDTFMALFRPTFRVTFNFLVSDL